MEIQYVAQKKEGPVFVNETDTPFTYAYIKEHAAEIAANKEDIVKFGHNFEKIKEHYFPDSDFQEFRKELADESDKNFYINLYLEDHTTLALQLIKLF